VRTKLYTLFEHYSNANKSSPSHPQSSSITTPTSIQGGGGIKSKGKRIFDVSTLSIFFFFIYFSNLFIFFMITYANY